MSKKIWTIIIILLVLVGLVYLFTGLSNNADENQNPATSTDSISVGLQDPRNVSVLIREVTLSEPGFVVIHKADANGQPGEVVATSDLLQPDTYQNLSIVLDFKAGERYIAMLHKDNGNGQFNIENDPAVKDENNDIINDIIMASFLISETPFVEGEADIKG